MSGLAYALGLSRQGLLDYSNKDDFSDTLRAARQRVEIALEQRLANPAVTGAIFNLKVNFKWDDQNNKQTSDAIGEMTEVFKKLSEKLPD